MLTALALAGAGVARADGSDGDGTLTYLGFPVAYASGENLVPFSFELPAGQDFQDGALQIEVPTGWSEPSINSSDPGYTTSDCGTVATSAQTITITGITLADPDICLVFYGDVPGPGVDAPASPGPATFAAESKATPGGTFTPLASSPDVQVLSPDGSGTMTTPTVGVVPGATGQTIVFTYTAAFGGTFDGDLELVVPPGWSPPSDNPTDAGFTSTDLVSGSIDVQGRSIFVFPLDMDGGDVFTVTYGDTSGGGGGAVAPATPARQVWQTWETSACGCFSEPTKLAVQPTIRVLSLDGAGTMNVKPSGASATGHTTLKFAYSPAPGGMWEGTVTIDVPASWSPASTNPTDPGYVTAGSGTVSVVGGDIQISGLTLFGGSLRLQYGSRAGGGPGALVPATPGPQTFAVQQRSSAGGTLTPLSASPDVTVYAPDGSGTFTTPTLTVTHSSTDNTITFTYTVEIGGISNGAVVLRVPGGWSVPSVNGADPGYTTATAGSVAVSGRTLSVKGLSLAAGNTFSITYGSQALAGPGATAPATTGPQTWTVKERSTSEGVLTPLVPQPVITIS
jgi:hypothetical protein